MTRTNLRPLLLTATATLATALGCAHTGPPPAATPQAPPAPDALSVAFDDFVAKLEAVEQSIRDSPAFGTPAEQVGGYRHMLRAMAKGLEAEVLQDADYPYFRILDFWLKEGGDNPDQRYAFVPIRGGETYRVWGRLGSAVRVEFQLYAGRPWDGTGTSAGYLAFEDMTLGEDGTFEVFLSAAPHEGNWLPNPGDATTLFARHIYGDWNEEDTGDIHIDRVGYEGLRRPPESPAELAARIEAAATMFATTARNWPAFVARRYQRPELINNISPPYDTYALGGARGRWMSGGSFALPPGEALVLRMPKTRAAYQAVQLADVWMASLEYANQISSLNTTQSELAPDGAYYYVISQEDPGYPNWLDAGALSRGVFMLRWDGVRGTLAEAEFPSARSVALEDLPEAIPGFTTVDEAERARVRAERRRHMQLRSHR
jgi:hypothetical protein